MYLLKEETILTDDTDHIQVRAARVIPVSDAIHSYLGRLPRSEHWTR